MDEKLYPKEPKDRNDHLDRPWILMCELVYDGGGCSKWSKGYRTRWGARVAAFFHHNIASYGGGIILVENRQSMEEKWTRGDFS